MAKSKIQILVFVVLFVGVLSLYSAMFILSTLEEYVMDHYSINSYQFGLLTSILSWTSLLDVVHGYLLDRYIGVWLASVIYSMLLSIGSVIIAISGYTKTFWQLMLGRVIFGLGSNPTILTVNLHIIHWFSQGKYINLVYSFNESVIMLGSSVVFFISLNLFKYLAKLYGEHSAFPLTLALESLGFCCVAVLSSLTLAYLYKYNESQLNKKNKTTAIDGRILTLKNYISFPLIFWMFCLSMFLYYISFGSFLNMSQAFFTTQYSVSPTQANTFSGLVTMVAFIFSSPFGIFLDKFGCNMIFLSISYILLIAAQGIFAFTVKAPLVPVIFIGLSITFSTSLWSLFQYLVDEHQCMIAYGMAQTGANASNGIGSILAGMIIQAYGYHGFTLFLFTVVLCTLPCLTATWILNLRMGNFLNLKPYKRCIYLGRPTYQKTADSKNCQGTNVEGNEISRTTDKSGVNNGIHIY